mmetsp:Transcript_17494/g.43555  ORF Transcript_17494/g.43555 Transcript_17494/m.43555 type:complete len:147 (-) Transcript_17494:146-586(-)
MQHYETTLEDLGATDAATVREMLMAARPFAAGKAKKRKRQRRVKSWRTEAMQEERRERLEEIEREARRKKELARELLQKINNKKWVKAPTAGEDMWRLVDDEGITFKVTSGESCENTGRDRRWVEGHLFYQNAPGGRHYSDLLTNN